MNINKFFVVIVVVALLVIGLALVLKNKGEGRKLAENGFFSSPETRPAEADVLPEGFYVSSVSRYIIFVSKGWAFFIYPNRDRISLANKILKNGSNITLVEQMVGSRSKTEKYMYYTFVYDAGLSTLRSVKVGFMPPQDFVKMDLDKRSLVPNLILKSYDINMESARFAFKMLGESESDIWSYNPFPELFNR